MMRVQKRNGISEEVSFDKVLKRIKLLSGDLPHVNVYELAQKVCTRIYDGVKTSELDELAAHMCSSMMIDHPDYGKLASRIIVSNHHKNTSPSFSETVRMLHEQSTPLVSDELYDTVMAHKEKLNSHLDYDRDYAFDYFGFKTLERGYLMRVQGRVVERPQHMLMRVALGIHGTDVKDALQTYDAMSKKQFVHATPTLFNAGTPCPQNSSCYLVAMHDDSIEGIFDTLKDCALISKYAGGIGMHIHNIRARNSRIRGTNGTSTGIIPMLRVYNNTARYVNQAGRRNGSIAVFLEPWHADIESFLDLRKNHGNEEERARDLFYALWIPDLFMKRVQENQTWSLMCPDACRGLADLYGDAFETQYKEYEAKGAYIRQVNAQELWFKILESQIETGTPYMLYKDAVNRKNNQMNLGTIKSSNLCTEIMEYTAPDECAVCNLASVCLPTFVDAAQQRYDHESLHAIVKMMTKNLNKIIDRNFYPIEKARLSNLRHRPIGIGVQGLADVYAMLRMPFDSEAARQLNRDIFETIYHAALEASMEIAKRRAEVWDRDPDDPYLQTNDVEAAAAVAAGPNRRWKGAYTSFEGSPASQGLLQFDLWGVTPGAGRYDWDGLKRDIQTWGLRNSLLLAPMPTASTSQIMGFNECFEPFTSNLYKRKTLAGEFILVNKYLLEDLQRLGLWNADMKSKLMVHEGSVQNISEIPSELRDIYKTAWELKQRVIIDQAADRGAFVCQSQSMNLFMESPDFKKLSSMHFYAWEKGLKTGMYYLRTKPKAKTQQFTVDPKLACSIKNKEACEMCSA